jgi:hypothetical protein|eukprot:scaffold502_cov327-Chaetoceros_neogracile.AAC.6
MEDHDIFVLLNQYAHISANPYLTLSASSPLLDAYCSLNGQGCEYFEWFSIRTFEKCVSAITKAIRLWKDWQLVMKTELKPWE